MDKGWPATRTTGVTPRSLAASEKSWVVPSWESRNVSHAQLGALSGLSRSAFADRFRAGLGVAPRQYLIRWRMERATTLLAATDLSVAEVADQVGYESEAAFSRTCRRVTGTPPATFRRSTKVRAPAT